jgi:hypothetical protein
MLFKNVVITKVKEILKSPEFHLGILLLDIFGEIFFLPAFQWLQQNNGHRAPEMPSQVSHILFNFRICIQTIFKLYSIYILTIYFKY